MFFTLCIILIIVADLTLGHLNFALETQETWVGIAWRFVEMPTFMRKRPWLKVIRVSLQHNDMNGDIIMGLCDIYVIITSKATVESLNCCVKWDWTKPTLCLTCKWTVEQSNSLMKYCSEIIHYIPFSAFSSPDYFFVLNHVIREHIMGNFVLFFNCQKIKGLMMRPPAISETELDVEICLLCPGMLFQVS